MKQDIDSFKDQISFIKNEVEKGLKKLPIDEEPSYLYDPIRFSLGGQAKRLRPILVHLSGQAFGADPEELMKGALSVELLHNFTLVHDDIMDGDTTRHGQPSVHAKWDVSTAILAGDGLVVLSQLLLSGLGEMISRRFNEVTLVVCEGQGMDKLFEHNPHISFDKYIDMIGRKTGALLGFCAELGGRLGRQDEDTCKKLYRFGLSLGVAFQIQDDILEIFGESTTMGKSLGSDITSGKHTALTLMAKEKDEAGWQDFRNKTMTLPTDEAMNSFRLYFEREGIMEKTSAVSTRYFDEALACLEAFPESGRSSLENFTHFIMNRTY